MRWEHRFRECECFKTLAETFEIERKDEKIIQIIVSSRKHLHSFVLLLIYSAFRQTPVNYTKDFYIAIKTVLIPFFLPDE